LSCAGAYIRFQGGNIEIHCPGQLSFKSANQSSTGPASLDVKHPTVAQGRVKEEERASWIHFSG
jgi:type VI secretion system secreted protein VgrG